MTSPRDIASVIAQAANPIEHSAFNTAWAEPEAQAALERILADHETFAPPVKRHRPRRRLALGTAFAAVAGAAAVIVVAPSLGHKGSSAWAVTKSANGDVTVKISDYSDPAGLQEKLRSAGLRADVVTMPASCSAPSSGDVKMSDIHLDTQTFQPPHAWRDLLWSDGAPALERDYASNQVQLAAGTGDSLTMTIRPSGLPQQDTVVIGFPAEQDGRSMSINVATTGSGAFCHAPNAR
jgi:hypothetical protein